MWELSPTKSVVLLLKLRGEWFPQCKRYSPERKSILAVQSQEIPHSHTAVQISHKAFVGKDTKRWLPLLRQKGH